MLSVRIKELSYTLDESTGFGSGFKYGIAEAEDELSFKENDRIEILENVDDNWLKGKIGDKVGIFPSSSDLCTRIL